MEKFAEPNLAIHRSISNRQILFCCSSDLCVRTSVCLWKRKIFVVVVDFFLLFVIYTNKAGDKWDYWKEYKLRTHDDREKNAYVTRLRFKKIEFNLVINRINNTFLFSLLSRYYYNIGAHIDIWYDTPHLDKVQITTKRRRITKNEKRERERKTKKETRQNKSINIVIRTENTHTHTHTVIHADKIKYSSRKTNKTRTIKLKKKTIFFLSTVVIV